MINKRLIIISSIMITLISLSLIYITYGYMTTVISGNENRKNMSLISQIIEVTYSDGSESLTSNVDGNFIPGSIIEKTFSIKNTGDKEVLYSIKLDNIENTFTRQSDITYEIYTNNSLVNSGIFPSTSKEILYNLSIKPNEINNYTLKIIYNESEENQIIDSGKTINGNISIIEDD